MTTFAEPATAQRLPRMRARSAWWVANVWLLFLLFPLASVITADTSQPRKIGGYVLLAVFAAVYASSNRLLVCRELGLPLPGRRLFGIDLDVSMPWLVALVSVAVAACAVAGWPMVGVTPFIVAFGMFHFSWPGAIAVFLATLTTAFVAPLIAGHLDDLWFFSVLVLCVGVAGVLFRLSEEHALDVRAMETQLAVSGERERVARDVHDVLGHSLTAVILKTQVVSRMIDRNGALDDKALAVVREQVGEIDTISRRALAEIRATVGGLRSADLGDELAAARAVLADAGVALTVDGNASSVPDAKRSVLGWVVRESVTNIVRHARATSCEISLGTGVMLTVTDDGVGLGDATEGNGLTGLRERLHEAGLSLRVEAGPAGRGTTVVVEDGAAS